MVRCLDSLQKIELKNKLTAKSNQAGFNYTTSKALKSCTILRLF